MSSPEPFNAAQWLVDRHVAAGDGGRVAFHYLDQTISYAELQRQTFRAARLLAELGVGRGERVLMVVRDEPEFPAFFLGALRVGAVPVPVSTMLRPGDVAALAADSQAAAAVVSEPFIDYLPRITTDGRVGVSAIVLGAGSHPPVTGIETTAWVSWTDDRPVATAATAADSTGFWLYTSGTTGRPKGAVHRHGDIRAVAATYGRSILGIGRDDICYSVAKLFFAFGLGNTLFFPLAVGASAVLDPESPTPGRVASLAAGDRPTLFFAPPGFCAALADSDVPAESFASVRATVTAGETLPAEVYRRFRARFGSEMLDGIGSTEALHIFCSNHLGDVQPGS
ncbi:MAG: AMP-binding protein, partial [Acidimicrobiaceae bacterium]|nr:AMP-binding protein [Acidimicrobiaceae bacterium]